MQSSRQKASAVAQATPAPILNLLVVRKFFSALCNASVVSSPSTNLRTTKKGRAFNTMIFLSYHFKYSLCSII